MEEKYQNLYSCHLVPESRLWDSLTDKGCFRVWLLVNFCGGSEGRRAGEDKRKKLSCGPVLRHLSSPAGSCELGKLFRDLLSCREDATLLSDQSYMQAALKQMWPWTRSSLAAGNSFWSKGEYEWYFSVCAIWFPCICFESSKIRHAGINGYNLQRDMWTLNEYVNIHATYNLLTRMYTSKSLEINLFRLGIGTQILCLNV